MSAAINYTYCTLSPILTSTERFSPGALESMSTVIGMRQRADVQEQAETFAAEESRVEVNYVDVERAKKVLGFV